MAAFVAKQMLGSKMNAVKGDVIIVRSSYIRCTSWNSLFIPLPLPSAEEARGSGGNRQGRKEGRNLSLNPSCTFCFSLLMFVAEEGRDAYQ